MSAIFEAPDAHDEPTLWESTPGDPIALIRRSDLSPQARLYWPRIVEALTETISVRRDETDRLQAALNPILDRIALGHPAPFTEYAGDSKVQATFHDGSES